MYHIKSHYSYDVPDCKVYAVGKPVYHGYTNVTYGSWMKDLRPRKNDQGVLDKYWMTKAEKNSILYEYSNKTTFSKDQPTKIYHLKYPFVVSSCNYQ